MARRAGDRPGRGRRAARRARLETRHDAAHHCKVLPHVRQRGRGRSAGNTSVRQRRRACAEARRRIHWPAAAAGVLFLFSSLCVALRCHGCRYGYFDGNAPRDTDIDVYQQASDQGAVTRGFACCQLRRILSVWIKHAFNNEHVKPFSPLSCVAPPDARPNMRCKRPSHEPGRRLRGSNQSARGLCVEH